MSIYDRAEDDSVETLLKGDGFSVMQDQSGRVRYDVWSGDIARSVPIMVREGCSAFDYANLAVAKLRGDAKLQRCLAPPVERLCAAVS